MTLNTQTIYTDNRQVSISFDNNAATAFLYLGKETSAWLTVDRDGDIYPESEINQGTVPSSVWDRTILRIALPAAVTAAALNQWLAKEKTQDLLETLHLGHELIESQARGREVGTLTEEAEDALVTLEVEALELLALAVWDVDEWFYDSSIQDLWPAGKSLKEAVAELESKASRDGVHLDGDVAEVLLDKAIKRAHDGHELTVEQRASISEAGRSDELPEAPGRKVEES